MRFSILIAIVIIAISSFITVSCKKTSSIYLLQNDSITEKLELYLDSTFIHYYKFHSKRREKTKGIYFGDESILILQIPLGKNAHVLSDVYNIRNDTLIHITERHRILTRK